MISVAASPVARKDFRQQFLSDVLCGLQKTRKELPSKYLYDAIGSRLFDVITELPEYGLTRAEERILRQHADRITALFPRDVVIAELGSGTGKKTRRILEALGQPATYYPIEISTTALAACETELSDVDGIAVVGLEREYLDGIQEVARRRARGEHIVVLFLGSTIGNFERKASVRFLQHIRGLLQAGDAMLLATDLMKPTEVLLNAYDDPLGVTAAFNLNLLARINRELCANFEVSQFKHVSRFNGASRAIEMHLESKRDQILRLEEQEFAFEKGETIWTESCHKYLPDEPVAMAHASGFRCISQWVDREWPFAENLLLAE